MVMNSFDNTDFQRVLNETVQPGLVVAIKLRSFEANMAKTLPNKSVGGKYYLIKGKNKGNFTAAGRPVGGKLPSMDDDTNLQDDVARVGTTQLKYGRRRIYKTTNMDGETFNSAKVAPNGAEDLAKMVLEDFKDNIPEEMSRMYATGQQGILGEITSVNKTTGVVTLFTAAAASNTGHAVSRPWAGNRYFREGMVISAVKGAAVSAAGGIGAGLNALRTSAEHPKNMGRKVTDVSQDTATCTVTFDDLAGNDWAQGDLLIVHGTRQEAAISTQTQFYEGFYNPQGLPDMVQTGSDTVHAPSAYVGDLAVSSNQFMQSIGYANTSSTAISPDMINIVNSQLFQGRLSAGNFTKIYCDADVYREAGKQFTTIPASTAANSGPLRYTEPGSEAKRVGVTGITFNTFNTGTGQAEFIVSPFASHFRALLLDTANLFVLEDKPWGFIDDAGQQYQAYENVDAVFAKLRCYQTGIATASSRMAGSPITGLKGNSVEL